MTMNFDLVQDLLSMTQDVVPELILDSELWAGISVGGMTSEMRICRDLRLPRCWKDLPVAETPALRLVLYRC